MAENSTPVTSSDSFFKKFFQSPDVFMAFGLIGMFFIKRYAPDLKFVIPIIMIIMMITIMITFAIRYKSSVHAYLNRCTHVAMELDWQPNQFFDDTGQWLLCSTHGAAYLPATGECAGGPCKGGLVKIILSEAGGVVCWHTDWNLLPLEF